MVSKISAEKAKIRLAQTKNAVMLDVRTKEEYDEGHVPGSILIPYDQIAQLAPVVLRDRNAEIYVGCKSGFRSNIACRVLDEIGYTKIYNVTRILDLM